MGSVYNIPKAIFYLLKGDYKNPKPPKLRISGSYLCRKRWNRPDGPREAGGYKGTAGLRAYEKGLGWRNLGFRAWASRFSGRTLLTIIPMASHHSGAMVGCFVIYSITSQHVSIPKPLNATLSTFA